MLHNFKVSLQKNKYEMVGGIQGKQGNPTLTFTFLITVLGLSSHQSKLVVMMQISI